VVYEFAIKFKNLLLDNLSGVKINENPKPIIIAVIDTATVIKVAYNNSSPQPFFPNDKRSISKGRLN
jgi:hypothetical protein